MCWNLEVTVMFCVLETLALGYCWLRNEYNDRYNVIGHLPIVAQEYVQAALWMVMDPADTQDVCMPANRILSFICAMIIHAVPQCLAWKAYLYVRHAEPGAPGTSLPMKRVITWYSLMSVAMWRLLFGTTAVLMISGLMISCTIKGPGGHQIWPLVMTPDPIGDWLVQNGYYEIPPIRLLSYVVYFTFVSIPYDNFPRADLSTPFIKFLGMPFIGIAMFFRGYEWGSMWCHYASIMCLLYILGPIWKRWSNQGKVRHFPEALREHLLGWQEDPILTSYRPGTFASTAAPPCMLPGMALAPMYQSTFNYDWGMTDHDVTEIIRPPRLQKEVEEGVNVQEMQPEMVIAQPGKKASSPNSISEIAALNQRSMLSDVEFMKAKEKILSGHSGVADELKNIVDLKVKGMVSAEEFVHAKERILSA